MDSAISDCVESLKDVRRNFHSSIDPSVSLALDEVIAKLERYKDGQPIEEAEVKCMVRDGLVIISSILSCCASLAELMRLS